MCEESTDDRCVALMKDKEYTNIFLPNAIMN